jgi:2',3'-cyclic-nucleotide 2'-phosphodiesterase (5'-nucleotidase family)
MSAPDGPRLRVISVNDVYSLENLPRLKNLAQHHLETDPADTTLFVIAGDFVAPTILSALDAGRGMIDCLNALGITHASLGNHENDIPPAELHRRVAELRAAWLSTNVQFDPAMPRNAIVEVQRGGHHVRVGLLAVVMNDPFVPRGNPFGGARIEPPVPTALDEASRLVRDERCDCVIALTHQPIPDDRRLAEAARAASLPLPLIVGGHEHVPFLETAARSQIVKSGMDATAACITDLVWQPGEPRPQVVARRESVAGYPEDAPLRARVDGHMAALGALASSTLVEIPPGQVVSSIGARSQQTSFGALVCSRLRDALRAEVCLVNGGGIRGSREYRTRLTYADLGAEIPFHNEIVVARMPGSVLRDAVAESRSLAPAESGGFLQVDDGVVVDGTTITAVAGAPLELTREYRVALVRNFFTGLDQIEVLVRFAREHPEKIPPPTSGRDIKHFLVDAFASELRRSDATDRAGRVT